MSGNRLVKPAPTSDEELIRQFEQRIRQLESRQTLRIGDHVLSQDDSGKLIVSSPALGSAPVTVSVDEVVDQVATRGFAYKSDVALAVSSGATGDINNISATLDGRWNDTGQAQYSADSAAAAAARIEAQLNARDTGMLWVDTFDRPYAGDLGTDYFTTVTPGVEGDYGTDGAGNTRTLGTGGAVAKEWTYRYTTPTNTNNQTITALLEAPPRDNGGGGIVQSSMSLCGRCDSTNATRVEAIVYAGSCYLGYRNAGSFSTFPGGGVGVGQSNGDRWDLLCGTALGPRHFVVLRNGLQVVDYNDLGETTAMDTDHRFGATGVVAGTTIQYFVLVLQVVAPTLQQLIVADRFW